VHRWGRRRQRDVLQGRHQHLDQAPGLGRHFLSEVVATLGLLLVIFALARSGRRPAPAAVGAYIGAAYFFTSSTSFANPAITVGRMFSDTFAGIAPSSVPSFIVSFVAGTAEDVEIRPYEPTDQTGFADLVATVLAEYGLKVDPVLEADLEHPDTSYQGAWVAVHNGRVVGSVAIRLLDDWKVAELKRIYLQHRQAP
jgi:hypothetical protein